MQTEQQERQDIGRPKKYADGTHKFLLQIPGTMFQDLNKVLTEDGYKSITSIIQAAIENFLVQKKTSNF